ncbi:MAG: hypothetical protein JOY80_12050 [Candidatus Dormibacteraeota bacterium]|nr:hypothetical protein [Candidatus Dormibacteraeota bacterium]
MASTQADAGRWLQERRVIVTAGGTREPIDPVRYLGNRSSGKMGNALAMAARDAGADVLLITAAPPPADPFDALEVVPVDTAEEMGAAVRQRIGGSYLLLMAAAVADYKPKQVSSQKIKKGTGTWVLDLEPTADILSSLRDVPERRGVFVVGFAAETTDLLENAQSKLREKGLDMIVLNDVSRDDIAMGAEANEVTLIDQSGVVAFIERAPKDVVAAEILNVIRSRMR